MFKVVEVRIGQEGDMEVDILDTVDNVVDTVPANILEVFFEYGMKIDGVHIEDGEIGFNNDVEIKYPQQESYEDEYEYDEYEDDDEYEDVGDEYDYDEEAQMDDFYNEEDGEEYSEDYSEIDSPYNDYDYDEEEDLDYYYEDINKNNMYDYFSEKSREIIKNYYRWYTKNLYKDLANSIRLGVSTAKAEQLANIRNRGTVWSFTGIYDSGDMGCSCCTLGHEIRYEFHAENEYGEDIIFGRECVKDFFNLDDIQLRNLTKTQNNMVNEIMEIADKTISGKVGLGKGEGLDFLYEVLYALDGNNELNRYLDKQLYKHLENFINNEIALPKSMVKEVRKQLTVCVAHTDVYEIGMRGYDTSEKLLKSIFKDTLGNISNIFKQKSIMGSKERYLKFLAYAFKNKLDGCYAHSPITGVCKEEGSCRKQRRVAWKSNENTLIHIFGFKDIGMNELRTLTRYLVLASEFTSKYSKIRPSSDLVAKDIDNYIFSNEEFKQMEVEDDNGVLQTIGEIIESNFENLRSVRTTLVECSSLNGSMTKVQERLAVLEKGIQNLYLDLYELALDTAKVEKPSRGTEEKQPEQKEQINGRYSLDKDVRDMCSKIIRAYSVADIRMSLIQSNKTISVQIANTIIKNNWYTDKQLYYIREGIRFLNSKGITDADIPEHNSENLDIENTRYELEDNPEIRDMVERVYNSALDTEMQERIQRLNKIIYDIAGKAKRYGNITEKQLKYIRMGDMEITKIENEREGR